MKTNDQSASFIDMHGATVSISVPADQVALYALIKSEQLAALNDLIADRTAGFQIEITENELSAFVGLAAELARTSKNIVAAIAEDVRANKKGGA